MTNWNSRCVVVPILSSATNTAGTYATSSSTNTFSVYAPQQCTSATAPTLLSQMVNPQFGIPQVGIPYVPDDIDLDDGQARNIKMPDGTIIRLAADGSYKIDDANAVVVYRASRIRDFNSFLNASDKVEAFIRFCGEVGVRQGDMLGIPIKHFVQWLVIEAAKADGEQPPLALPDLSKPRCLQCGRFMSRANKARRIEFCRVQCFEKRLRNDDG